MGRRYVIPRHELAGNVAATDAHHVKNRRIRGLGQLEPLLNHIDDTGQIGARIQEPHLCFHCKRVTSLLHNA